MGALNMVGVTEVKKVEPRVKASILNLYTVDSIEDILKIMINYDRGFFEEKFKNELERMKDKTYKTFSQIDERILHIMKNKNKIEGSSTELYITILENEFFSADIKYEEIFHEQYMINMDYYFNCRKVFGMDFISDKKVKLSNEIYSLLTNKFKHPDSKKFENKLVTSYITIEENYSYFYKNKDGVTIYEKIGIQNRSNTGGAKSVFVRYYFDLKNNYFEISYNDSAIKDLSKEPNRKNILLKVERKSEEQEETISEKALLDKKFSSETQTLRTLKSRIRRLSNEIVDIISLNKEISAELNKKLEDEDFKISNEQKIFYESPYEGVMYLYFKENREKIVNEFLNDATTEKLKEIKEEAIKTFKSEYTLEVEKSIKFLNYLIVFSELKSAKREGKEIEDYIYAFTVRDHEVTKTSTKNADRLPVYNTDFYWHLQQVADSIKQLSELGLFKSAMNSNNKTVTQEIKIAYINDHLHFVYYQKSINVKIGSAIKVGEARRLVHESIKSEFRKIISKAI